MFFIACYAKEVINFRTETKEQFLFSKKEYYYFNIQFNRKIGITLWINHKLTGVFELFYK